MRKGIIRIIAFVTILAIIPATVFAGFVCSHHDWKIDGNPVVVGYSQRSDVPSSHWRYTRENYKCAHCTARKSEQVQKAQPHNYTKDNGLKNGYDEDVTNANKHILTVYHEKQCVCGKKSRTIFPLKSVYIFYFFLVV